MSDINTARRTKVEVFFGGVDITDSIQPYFKSLTYIDNEEDEADDLQIQLADKDNIWLEQWLNDIVDTAASAAKGGEGLPTTKTYKVTAKIGLNIRSGPGTKYKKLGAFAFGAKIEVSEIKNEWAAITHKEKAAYVSAKYLTSTGATAENKTDPLSATNLEIQATIVSENTKSDGKDKALICGQFELDSLSCAGPPSAIDIRATALPYSTQIRQTEKNRAWEACHLSDIANDYALANNMACLFESANDPFYERVEQVQTSDIEMLSKLCHDAGISLKASNNILILFDQETYEEKPAVLIIKRGDGSYTKWKLSSREANKKFASCRVSYTDPTSGKSVEATVFTEDYDEKKENNQQLEITAKVFSIGEAKELAEKSLRLHNKYQKTASFTLPGNPDLLAGLVVELEGWGMWSGKHIIKQAKHSVGNGGYITQIELRRALEGY